MKSLATLYALVALLLAVASQSAWAQQKKIQQREMDSEAIVPLRTHTVYAPYVDSNLQNKFWDFGGDTIIDTTKSIRLTQDRPHEMGWFWSRLPITAESMEIIVELNVDGHSNNLAGDGMAMWLTQERAKPGPVFGSMNYFTGLGIFFDTYPNARHPYHFPRISVMNGNGVEAYENARDGARQEVAGCSIDFRRTKVATRAKFTHIKNVYTSLEIQHDEWDHWDMCFKVDNITLPLNPYLGFTALTGDVSDAHEIGSIQTSNIMFKPKNAEELAAFKAKHFFTPDPSAAGGAGSGFSIGGFFAGLFGFAFTLVKWGLVLAVIAALVLVGLKYQKRQNAKRF
ncbi:uncharacterized protein PFL1_05648 [Pseudozyma flocculosa PF-1]|uniref:Related to vesicular integral-membrane protein VIP36 n=2 Tax=Pseudozyma flocculosa TaxID=84751 RepID=A0A5C3FER3_9BASI|nr:uncharacterized protein PFL1_05648 [Pseudozyma flocculosa PF-1]EPQ26668.1 hypothetical protein PFL1_05648 [Pseudozyma flocculosa PF-1]SPO42167.1 related to vesicular integral-membrane protein VIP36 [Pseudozyma flocculosa]